MFLSDRDYDLFRKAAWEHQHNPDAENGIHFKCFNQEEAILYKFTMQLLYPEVPVTVSWMEFTETARRAGL